MAVRVEKDIVFRHARVGFHGAVRPLPEVALRLDAYLPSSTRAAPAPALVMAFCGAFHRGSKESDAFTDGTGTSTSVAEYCRRFAARGVPSFSVEYRLAQSDPEPGTPLLGEPDRVPMSRINPVRAEMGLGPIAPRRMAGIMEAAFDDVTAAVAFVRRGADRFGIDPRRIVLGGFSAGGRCAMYAAYGKRVDVAGVVSISGPLVPGDAAAFLSVGSALPPLLMISGEHDLDYVRAFVPDIAGRFRSAGIPVESIVIPAATHFFAAETPVPGGRTVEGAIRDAVARWTGFPPAET